MTHSTISNLLRQYADNSISREDYLKLISYFKLSGSEKEIDGALDELWDNLDAIEVDYSDTEKNELYSRMIGDRRFRSIGNIKRLHNWLFYAAAVALILVSSVFLYVHLGRSRNNSISVRYRNDIMPGSNRATLTLANGKVINLNDAVDSNLTVERGVRVTNTKKGQLTYTFTNNAGEPDDTTQYNTVTTPRGGQYQISLPDGSKVWLNAVSSIKFPVRFSKHERRVTLTGEGYFEVTKNADKPFRVITAGQQIQVLGTHFNVNAYGDVPGILTTLLEGSVKVTGLGFSEVISPGEQSNVTKTGIKVAQVDTEEAMAWKNGLFLYNSQDLESIMKEISRWYNVKVVFEKDHLKKQMFSGALSRFKNISQLLEVLEATGSVHFKIEGRVITAMN